jgi:hypothetical protein
VKVITRQEAIAQGLKHYFTGKPCKHGHLAPRFTNRRQCLECNRLAAAARYFEDPQASTDKVAAWREVNRESYLAKGRAYYQENKEEILRKSRVANATSERKAAKASSDRAYRDRNAENIKAKRRAYYEENKARIKRSQAEYSKARASVDPAYRLVRRLRKRVWDALVKGYKAAPTLELIGCSVDSLMDHLEAQFAEGMTWDNYGRWHVDHIRPCASFDLTDPAQQRECFHWSNLQPLWALENLQKGAKLAA